MHLKVLIVIVRKFVSGLLLSVFILTIIPIELLAQNQETACQDGRRMARRYTGGPTWFAYGCVLGPFVFMSGFRPDNPPAANLVGKRPEYVAAYTDCYRAYSQTIKRGYATNGCMIATVAWIGIGIAVFAGDNGSTSSRRN